MFFFAKSRPCQLVEGDEIDFDGNTFLLECENNEYVYFSGCEILKFKTDDKIIDYISLMGNNMCLYTIAIGEKFTYFISNPYKLFENHKVEEGASLNATNNSLDPYDYHLGKCYVDSFKTLERSQILSCYFDDEDENVEEEENDILIVEDEEVERNYYNGYNEVLKILIKSVLYVMKEIVFMHLDNVVISVFATNVIKIRVIMCIKVCCLQKIRRTCAQDCSLTTSSRMPSKGSSSL